MTPIPPSGSGANWLVWRERRHITICRRCQGRLTKTASYLLRTPARFDRQGASISEAAIVWERNGGVLITSDALQHYVDWRFFSWPSVLVHRIMGFGAGTIVGPMWHRFLVANETEARKTFEMLLDLPFTHALGLHGGFVEGNAKAAISAAISREMAKGRRCLIGSVE